MYELTLLNLILIQSTTLPRAQLVASFIDDISRLSQISQTNLGGNFASVGFASTGVGRGCIRQLSINDVYYDISSSLARCDLESEDMCSHEHFCPGTAEHCIKTSACDQDVTSLLQPTSPEQQVSAFISQNSIYFHGFEVSNTVNTTLTIELGNSTRHGYHEDGQLKVFQFGPGRQRRFLAWPVISDQIRLVFQSGSRTAFGLRIFGGSIESCRLHDELSGRNWWKLVKVDARLAVPSDIVFAYGVQNDFDPQSREVDFSLSSSQYKNKLVDEWETLGIKRVELNAYNQNGKFYAAVYNADGTSKTSWIGRFLYSTINDLNIEVDSWEQADRVFRNAIVEIQATTLESITESKFKQVSGVFHVDDMSCQIDGVRDEDLCASRCFNSTCVGFFIDVQVKK